MWLTQRDQLLNRGLEVWKPVIAAVNGYCLGGGMTLLLATDIRVAAEPRDLQPRRGQARHHRRQRRHAARAAAAALRDRHGDAADRRSRSTPRPRRAGASSTRSCRRQRCSTPRLTIARKIAANAPLAVQAAKELAVRCARDGPRRPACASRPSINRMLAITEDAKEGPAAFAAKRRADVQGSVRMHGRTAPGSAARTSRSSTSARSTTAPTAPS